jgi:hypothetical protein
MSKEVKKEEEEIKEEIDAGCTTHVISPPKVEGESSPPSPSPLVPISPSFFIKVRS